MKILLAVDASPSSEVAVDEVANRSWPAGTAIEVLSVLDTTYVFDSELVEHLETRTKDFLASVARRLDGKPVMLNGDPKKEIVDRAEVIGADMVVTGSHEVSGVDRFFLGSVAKTVIRYAPCSVLVVRNAMPPDVPRKILLATDGSDAAEAAARSVGARTWPAGTEVRVLTVVEMVLNTFQATLEPPFMNTEVMEELRAQAMQRAENAVIQAETILREGGLNTSESISVLVESPKQIIVDEAKSWGADLIVVGSHGWKGIDRFLLGSVSEAVATHAPCSVEVIRKPKT